MDRFPKVGIVYLSYHSEPYLARVIEALRITTYPKDKLFLIVVDNPHPDFGSSKQFLEENLLPLSGKNFPTVEIMAQVKNMGFARGNNIGMERAIEADCAYIFLHNQDGFGAETMLEKMVAALEADERVGAAQALVTLYPETHLINSAGNQYHFLGFGYCNKFRKPVAEAQKTEEIGYASGAALLLRSDLIKTYGGLDEDLYLYHEDLEYSLRLKSVGYKVALIANAIFYHEYSFERNLQKMYLMERNRLAVLLMYYRLPTLFLLFPIAFILELGLLVFAAKKGWLKEKLRVYWYWLKPTSWKLWFGKRQVVQRVRKVSDRQLLDRAVGVVVFDDPAVQSILVQRIGNPILAAYWKIVKKILVW